MKPQVKPDHYNEKYDSKERFCSYWHQINEILTLKSKNVLEIGIGNNFVSNYLKGKGLEITTLDIDKELNPDIVSSVLNMPLPNNSFNVVACYETLEHLPYENFKKTLSEIYRVSKEYAIISLPDVHKVYRFNVQIPRIGEIKKLIFRPQFKLPIHKFDGQHYWEIGKKRYPLKRITIDIKKTGFVISKTYRIFECPYHRFFVLRKEDC